MAAAAAAGTEGLAGAAGMVDPRGGAGTAAIRAAVGMGVTPAVGTAGTVAVGMAAVIIAAAAAVGAGMAVAAGRPGVSGSALVLRTRPTTVPTAIRPMAIMRMHRRLTRNRFMLI